MRINLTVSNLGQVAPNPCPRLMIGIAKTEGQQCLAIFELMYNLTLNSALGSLPYSKLLVDV